jgi:hypothetical protein
MSKPLFLVSSAIKTRHGKFSAQERLDQTIKTLESIKSKASDARILLIECSAESSVTDEESKKLEPFIEGLLNYHPDNQVQEIYKMAGDNWDVAKNFTELVVYGKALDFIVRQQPQLLNDVSRVFKMSGRYLLNDNFDLSKHLDPVMEEKYIFATRKASQFPAAVTGGMTNQLSTRLWSWPTNKTALVFFRYNIMIETFIGNLAQQRYVDIEHLAFHYFSGPYLSELPLIGVEGLLGPNGNQVKD